MSVEALYLLRKIEPRQGLRDLDGAVLTQDAATDDGDVIPVGTEGTVVGVLKDGVACVVEFPEPAGALATVASGGLRLARHP